MANYYIRIQGSVVSWEDRRISRLAAAMATRTGTEQAGRWATPAGDRDRSRRPQDSARQRQATAHRQAAPAHRRPPRRDMSDHRSDREGTDQGDGERQPLLGVPLSLRSRNMLRLVRLPKMVTLTTQSRWRMVMLTARCRRQVMGIRFLSRSEYCSLAGLEVEQLNVLRRRDQTPSVPNLDLTEEVANERGYEAGGALLLIVANELVERYEMSRDCAARVAAFGSIMFERWEEIAATSAEIAAGEEPPREILFALIDWPGVQRHGAKNRPPQKVAIGNLKEVTDRHSDARTILAVSLTRCAALMRRRATKARIDLDEFWSNKKPA